jgi:hypothetical protein
VRDRRFAATERLELALIWLEVEPAAARDAVVRLVGRQSIGAEHRVAAMERLGAHDPLTALRLLDTFVRADGPGVTLRIRAARSTGNLDPAHRHHLALISEIARDGSRGTTTRLAFADELASLDRVAAGDAFIVICDDEKVAIPERLKAGREAARLVGPKARSALLKLSADPKASATVQAEAERLAGPEPR